MTLQELSKYYDIQMTLEKDREALENLRQKINPASPQLTGMPHTPGVRDKVADLAVELADMDERGLQLPRITLTDKPCICGAFYFCLKTQIQPQIFIKYGQI